jgi:IS5 family transposase
MQATQKIIQKCKVVAKKEEVELRQSYSWILKQLSRVQLFRNHPTNKAKAKKADKKKLLQGAWCGS